MSVSPQDPPEVTGSDFGAVRARKATVRAEFITIRRQLPVTVLARSAERIAATLRSALPELLRAGGAPPAADAAIAAYVPFGAEPGGPGLPDTLRALRSPPAPLLLPVLRDDQDLDWARYAGALSVGRSGLSEPPGPRWGVMAVGSASLVLVPALAVDRRGVRLGRGGGSYDRALARVPSGVPVVALLHDGELSVLNLPAEPHDRLVTAVITPGDGLQWLPVP